MIMKIITDAEVRSFSQYIGNIKSAMWIRHQGLDKSIIFCSDFAINELELLGFTEAVRRGLDVFVGLDIECEICHVYKAFLNADYLHTIEEGHPNIRLLIPEVIKNTSEGEPEHYQEWVKNTFETAQDYILVEYRAKSRMDKNWLWKLFHKRKLNVRLAR